MNILILSWRDPQHPLAGGAERITQKYAEYWTLQGHQVQWVSGQFPNSPQSTKLNGVDYLRIGPQLSHLATINLFLYPLYVFNTILAARSLIKERKIDKVIDQIHGLPFFTPLFASEKNVLMVCEVAGPIWDKMYPFPINLIGKLIENFCYYLYQPTVTWAISRNTKKDILSINPKISVKVLPLGIDINNHPTEKKDSNPSAVFVARLVKMKGIETALEAAQKICTQLPDFQLTIIGKGSPAYEKFLKQKITDQGLSRNIKFLGYVSEAEKYRILAKSHFLLHPSFKEGFGLTVLESGLVGTPAIVRQGSSLDELIIDGIDGYIISSAEQMADKFMTGYQSKDYQKMTNAAIKKSLQYDWLKVLPQSKEITGIK